MAGLGTDPIKTREKFVRAWNDTMVKIWAEKIDLLANDKGFLLRSPKPLQLIAEDDYKTLRLSHRFLEYGLWQDYGTGREFTFGNGGNVPSLDPAYRKAHRLDKPRPRGPKWGGGMTSGNPRERHRWFSPKYYSSIMRLRDYMALSLGEEFKYMFCSALDASAARASTAHYRRNGLTP